MVHGPGMEIASVDGELGQQKPKGQHSLVQPTLDFRVLDQRQA